MYFYFKNKYCKHKQSMQNQIYKEKYNLHPGAGVPCLIVHSYGFKVPGTTLPYIDLSMTSRKQMAANFENQCHCIGRTHSKIGGRRAGRIGDFDKRSRGVDESQTGKALVSCHGHFCRNILIFLFSKLVTLARALRRI